MLQGNTHFDVTEVYGSCGVRRACHFVSKINMAVRHDISASRSEAFALIFKNDELENDIDSIHSKSAAIACLWHATVIN